MIFRKYGRTYQLRIETPADLEYIKELDKARWAATSAPIEQLYADPAALKYIDTDNNGRIRVEEMGAAQKWLWEVLTAHGKEQVAASSEVLRLDDLNPQHPDTAHMRELASHMLGKLDAADKKEISLSQLRSFRNTYTKSFPNGDGIVPPSQVQDREVQALCTEILNTVGGALELSGESGVREEDLDRFLKLGTDYLAWEAEGAAAQDGVESGANNRLPWDADTAAAGDLVEKLNAKVAQYFALCDLLALEPNASTRLQASPEALAELDVKKAEPILAWVENAPLAPPRRDGQLNLLGPVNPVYQDALSRLAETVLPRALPGGLRPSISRKDWEQLRALFAPYRDWQQRKPEGPLTQLGSARLREILFGPLPEKLRELLHMDQQVAEGLKQFNNLERLILYQRWLMEIANSFVSFPALFDPHRRTLFEAGTLIIDARELTFCVRVSQRAEHKRIAEGSQMFLAYLEVRHKEGELDKQMEIAAAVTAGDRGNLTIGKRGIFYDRYGVEWDAQIIDVIVNPISLFEATTAPFWRIKALVGERITRFAQSRSTGLDTAFAAQADQAAVTAEKGIAGAAAAAQVAAEAPSTKAPRTAVATVQPSSPSSLLIGGTVAVAALGAAFGIIVQAISSVAANWRKAVAALLIVAIITAGFSALLGWLKLRRRDLSTVLEACGWAVNSRMRLTRRLSLLFTRTPGLPASSIREEQTRSALHFRKPTYRRITLFRRAQPILLVGLVLLLIWGLSNHHVLGALRAAWKVLSETLRHLLH